MHFNINQWKPYFVTDIKQLIVLKLQNTHIKSNTVTFHISPLFQLKQQINTMENLQNKIEVPELLCDCSVHEKVVRRN